MPPTSDVFSFKGPQDSPFSSFREFQNGPVLPWASIGWFGSLTQPADKMDELRAAWPDWWFAPLRAPSCRGLCPTLLRTGECDPLRDEGEAYGMKLVAAGVKVTMKRYLGSVHTFMSFKELAAKKEYDADAVSALKEAHGMS